jgi:hypothetical protein
MRTSGTSARRNRDEYRWRTEQRNESVYLTAKEGCYLAVSATGCASTYSSAAAHPRLTDGGQVDPGGGFLRHVAFWVDGSWCRGRMSRST